MVEEVESWNMAKSYYMRIDNILTYCMTSRMNNEGNKWHKGLQSLYCEVVPKMKDGEKEEATIMLAELTKMINEGRKTIPTKMFMDFEIFLRTILEKRGMLTPKRDVAGL